jgi:hypothetical protein
MGYTEEDVRSDPTLAAYCRQFDVQSEVARLTGVHSSR